MPRTKHGESNHTTTVEYAAWRNAKTRCENPRHGSYRSHGARGIAMCQEWRDSYEAFLEHVGRRPGPSFSLDRIDNDRGYEPGNVRWADKRTQRLNARTVRWVRVGERVVCVKEAARMLGIGIATAHARVRSGELQTVKEPTL